MELLTLTSNKMRTQSGLADSQVKPNSMIKILREINTISKFLLFRMKYIIDWGCLFDN